jgi:hypothetical protein
MNIFGTVRHEHNVYIYYPTVFSLYTICSNMLARVRRRFVVCVCRKEGMTAWVSQLYVAINKATRTLMAGLGLRSSR